MTTDRSTQIPSQTAAVVCRSLTKRYGDHVVFDDFNLTVNAGEVVALVGPNGSGKTTILRLIAGLTAPSGGTTQVFGSVHSVNRRTSGERVGAVIQGVSPDGGTTPRRQIERLRSWRAENRSTETVLGSCQLLPHADTRIDALSGGMRQRLALAQALLGPPSLLVLDEPTSALDLGARDQAWDLLRAFAEAGGTIVLATHSLEEVTSLAARAVPLDGNLSVTGPIHSAMSVPDNQ